MIGKVLDDRYKILEQIGEGGMGAVFAAERVDTGAPVAIKVILAENLQAKAGHVRRFHREARAAGSIDAPNITQVLDTGTADGRPYMAMELMKGRDLGKVLRAEGALAVEVAVAIAAQACRGLARAHAAGIIHRDIKPGNVFLSEHGDEVIVKVCDFGIAKLDADVLRSFHESTLTKTGTLLGSPLYMAPEQARGKRDIDARADVWSIGTVLYRMLAGRAPFQDIRAFGDLIIAVCTTPVPPVQDFAPWVSPEVAEVLHRALRLRPEERYQTADEMADALTALLPSTTITTDMVVTVDDSLKSNVQRRAALEADEPAVLSRTETGLANTQFPAAERSRSLLMVAAGAAIALALVGLYSWLGASHAPSPSQAAAPPTPTVSPPPPIVSVAPSSSATGAPPSSASAAVSARPELPPAEPR